jgi:hypothetical protein
VEVRNNEGGTAQTFGVQLGVTSISFEATDSIFSLMVTHE